MDLTLMTFFSKEIHIVHCQYQSVNYSKLKNCFAKFSLLVLVGIGFGALINYMEPRVFPEFGPELFFHWLLPPIILEAAYSLYHRAFLQNIGTILLFAVVVSMKNSSVYAAHFQSFRPTPSATGPSFRTLGPFFFLQWW
jgi:hypothetical protein